MKTALVLFAHGARDPEWAAPLRRVRASIVQRSPAMPVELAFLEFLAPTLPECAAELIRQGADKVVILPMFIARGGHLKREVPEMLDALRQVYPDVEFVLQQAVGENAAVIRAMADVALELAELPPA
ncbi:MAG: Cobalamin [Proteobacteria bacterium]|nr:Cobalamin [Pseudomonadota bacterium]